MTADPKRLDPREVLSVLRRQRSIWVGSMGAALLGALIYLWLTPPLYRASALIMVDPRPTNLLGDAQNASGATPGEMTSRIEGEAEILRSDATVLALIEAMDLLSDPEFGPHLSRLDQVRQVMNLAPAARSGAVLLSETLARVKQAVTVRRKGMTYLLQVSMTARTPDRAAALTNQLVSTSIARQVQSKVQATLQAKSALEGQLGAAQDRLVAAEGALTTYLDGALLQLAEQSDDPDIRAIRQRLISASADLTGIQDRLDSASQALSLGDWEGMAQALEQDAVAQLLEDQKRFARRLEQGGDVDKAQLLSRLQQVEQDLQSAGTQGVRRLQAELTLSADREASARQAVQQAMMGAGLPAETLSELYGRQQDAAIAQRHYDTVLQRARDLEAQAPLHIADSRVVSPALPPGAPVSPSVRVVLLLAGVVGLLLGGLWAWFREYIAGGVHAIDQLQNITGVHSGVSIPLVTPVPPQIGPADAILDQPMGTFAEAFRRLRADLSVAHPADQGVVIMVGSSLPGEGKSVCALALARTFDRAGKRTLLIDADLRKPTLHQFLGAEPQASLLAYLTADDDGRGAYDVDPRSNLGVILGRQNSDVPTDQPLQSDAFRDLIASARERFDVVIIDTPPLLPVVDGRYVAALSDAAVVCVRAHKTDQRELRQAWQHVRDNLPTNAPAVPVLTQERSSHGQQYYGY